MDSISVDKESLLTVGLVLLVLIGAVQGVQIHNLQESLGGQTVITNSYASAPQAEQVQLPSGLQNLPQQVGGC